MVPGQASPPSSPVVVPVGLGARSYEVLIGPSLIAEAGPRIAASFPDAACGIVTDENVARDHLPALTASLDRAGIRHQSFTVPAGEASKSYGNFERICDSLLAARLERRDCVIALGGGVVGDLAGFAASCLKRGLPLVQIPTSLLAQVDSSVGGKTAINSPHGKNLVGAFHQPRLVLADTNALDTLPEREFRAGYAELVKYGLIDDQAFFEWCEQHRAAIFKGGPERVEAIRRAVAAKAAVVARDEFETGDRALLNLGHTFGHALERLTGYDGTKLVHGEAVAIGMSLAFRFSVRQGLCSGQDAERVVAHLRAAGLPTYVAPGLLDPGLAAPEAMLDAMAQDKKNVRGRLTLILARGIGESFIARDADAGAVGQFLRDELAR